MVESVTSLVFKAEGRIRSQQEDTAFHKHYQRFKGAGAQHLKCPYGLWNYKV